MTRHAVLLLALLGCGRPAASGAQDPEIARARTQVDQLLAAADLGAQPAVVVAPAEARETIVARGPALSACAPNRRDLGVLMRDGKPVAFDRALARDGAVEQCVAAALAGGSSPALPPRVVFVPAYLPGGKPQILKIDPSTTSLPLDELSPTIETSIVVAPGVDPGRLAQLLDRLQSKGFEKLALRVLE